MTSLLEYTEDVIKARLPKLKSKIVQQPEICVGNFFEQSR